MEHVRIHIVPAHEAVAEINPPQNLGNQQAVSQLSQISSSKPQPLFQTRRKPHSASHALL